MDFADTIIDPDDAVLVTGATGFIGVRLVRRLIEMGYRNVRCLVRPSSNMVRLEELSRQHRTAVNIMRGNLLSREDSVAATEGISVIYHLALGPEQSRLPMPF